MFDDCNYRETDYPRNREAITSPATVDGRFAAEGAVVGGCKDDEAGQVQQGVCAKGASRIEQANLAQAAQADEVDAVTGASPGTAQACNDLGLNSLEANLSKFGIKPPGQA